MPFGVEGFDKLREGWLIPFLKTKEVQSITNDEKIFYGLIYHVFIDSEHGEYPAPYEQLSPRKFMQLLGTEYFRFCKDDFFVCLMQNSYKDVIIPDVRFENEAAICDLLIGIYRDVPSVNSHVSERFADFLIEDEVDETFGKIRCGGGEWSGYLIIHNTQDIFDLERKLRKHVNFGNI